MLRAHSLRDEFSAQSFKLDNVVQEESIKSFQTEFALYAKDIKEVRSLVNLWKEEFFRRKANPLLPNLETAVMNDSNRTGGYSQSIIG